MEELEYQGKFCEECRFFKVHYAIADTEFYKTSFGHCSSDLATRDKIRYIRTHNTACKHWQPMKPTVLERREILKDTLSELAERLNEIALIIEHDRRYDF